MCYDSNVSLWLQEIVCRHLKFLPRDQYKKRDETMMTSSNGNIFRVTGPLRGEFTGPGEFPAQRPVTRSFDVFFDLRLNKRLSKQPPGWWFETPLWPLWRQCNGHWGSLQCQIKCKTTGFLLVKKLTICVLSKRFLYVLIDNKSYLVTPCPSILMSILYSLDIINRHSAQCRIFWAINVTATLLMPTPSTLYSLKEKSYHRTMSRRRKICAQSAVARHSKKRTPRP